MTDPTKIELWASRYLDLWERHLAAENDRPTVLGDGKSEAQQLAEPATDEDTAPGTAPGTAP